MDGDADERSPAHYSTSHSRSVPPLVAHVIYRLDVGGLENGVVNLLNRLPETRYRHAIICITEHTGFRSRLHVEVPVYAVRKRDGKDPGHYWRLWKLLRRLRPAIVHTRNLSALEAQLPAFLAGVRCRVHGEHGRDIHDIDGTRRRYQLLRRIYRPLIDRFIPLSSELEDYLRVKVGVPQQKIRAISNGVDLERFRPSSGRGSLAVAPFHDERANGPLVVGTVSRMEKVKDPLTLARAFVELARSAPHTAQRLRLVMIGDGSLKREVEDYLRREKLGAAAWLPGAREDVPELLRAMDLFVLPSLAEGISNTILEAMASGLPVVATAVGGNQELVVADETGYLVPRSDASAMAQAMRRYVENPELLRQHGEAGRARAEQHHGIDRMVEQYLNLYDSVLAEKSKQPVGMN